jgi:hypothetical protein
MSIIDKINEIKEKIDNRFTIPFLPLFLVEHIFLVILIVGLNRFVFDGPYLYKESLMSILILYCFNWFVFRITAALFGMFDFFQILTPLKCLTLLFITTVILTMLFPKHEFIRNAEKINNIQLSDEEMASNCNEAKWTLTINYEIDQAYLFKNNLPMKTSKDVDFFTVTGNTEQAKIMAQKIIKTRLKFHPEFKYVSCDIGLIYMPRKFCQENNYGLRWSITEAYSNEL